MNTYVDGKCKDLSILSTFIADRRNKISNDLKVFDISESCD